MQNSHRAKGPLVSLPEDWGLRWWRADYALTPIDAPTSPVSARAAEWEWCEGVFWSEDRGTPYEPIQHAPEIFDAALHVDPDDTASILSFVRAWGVLGASTFDRSLWATRRALRELQRHFAWMHALKSHGWRSSAVPALWDDRDAFVTALYGIVRPPEHARLQDVAEDVRDIALVREAVLTDLERNRRTFYDPYVSAFVKGHFYAAHARYVRPRDREEQHWRAFGWSISEHLRAVNPAIGWTDGRPTAAWEVPQLVDLLWVQLWNLATGGAAIRRCRHCQHWFPVDHRGKVYCSRVCTNRASAKASYEARMKNVPGNVPAGVRIRPRPSKRQPKTKKKTPR